MITIGNGHSARGTKVVMLTAHTGDFVAAVDLDRRGWGNALGAVGNRH